MLTHNILVPLEKRGFVPNFHFLSHRLTGVIKQGQMELDTMNEGASEGEGERRKGMFIVHVFLKRASAALDV